MYSRVSALVTVILAAAILASAFQVAAAQKNSTAIAAANTTYNH